jgi:DNA-binding NarL/FixJ family response regulator
MSNIGGASCRVLKWGPMPYRILIADDHSLVRKVLKTMLENHPGWQICAMATNGLEAVQKAAELQPDLIILDFSMPLMDGLEAARRILSASPSVPILIFTNYYFPSLVEEAEAAGVRQVIDKGLAGHELVLAVENILNGKGRPAAASA